MALREQIQKLANDHSNPCLTISLNTHRTHPDNTQDVILLKNALKEAEDRLVNKYEKRAITPLLDKIATISSEIDVNYNLDSLHLFLSNETQEIVKSTWSTSNQGVHISDNFALRSLIKDYNRSENYLIMVLSQSGAQLYEAINDGIVQEITNDDFPFTENPHAQTAPERGSDPKHIDDLVREFFNKIDKAVVRVHQETDLNCIVICTENNYSRLQQVADRPGIYVDYAAIDYNNVAPHQVAQQAWEIIKKTQQQRRTDAIHEMQEAIAHGTVVTDLQEIFQAAIDGRGDLLIVHQDFVQPVIMKDERTFDIVDNPVGENTIDDITSNIAWEVLSKKGRVIFTAQDEIKELGKIVLKTRY